MIVAKWLISTGSVSGLRYKAYSASAECAIVMLLLKASGARLLAKTNELKKKMARRILSDVDLQLTTLLVIFAASFHLGKVCPVSGRCGANVKGRTSDVHCNRCRPVSLHPAPAHIGKNRPFDTSDTLPNWRTLRSVVICEPVSERDGVIDQLQGNVMNILRIRGKKPRGGASCRLQAIICYYYPHTIIARCDIFMMDKWGGYNAP